MAACAVFSALVCTRAAFGQGIGLSWQALGAPGGRISQLAGTADGQELYAVSVSGVNRGADQTQRRDTGAPARADALYKSVDRGASWQPVTNDLPPGAITALHVEPDGAGVYVAVSALGDANTQRPGLWRSTDHGGHWQQVRLDRDDLIIRSITRGAGDLFFGAVASGRYPSAYVYRMNDADATWTGGRADLPIQSSDRVESVLSDLIAHPVEPGLLFLTTHFGDVYRSSDAGQTWQLVSSPAAPGATGAALLAISPDRPDTVLLTRLAGSAGAGSLTFERSTDRGATWRPVTATELPATSEPRTLMALPGGIFLLNTVSGTFRSADNGVTWQPLEGALSSGGVARFLPIRGPSARGDVLAATGYGLFASEDGGALWQPLGAGLPPNSTIASVLTHPERPGLIYILSDNRIPWDSASPPAVLSSTDGGQHWMPASQGLPDVPITAWTLDPDDPGRLYAASWEHVFRSADGGLSWQSTRLEPGPRNVIAVAASDVNVLYLGGRPLLRSTDRGASWQPVPVTLTKGDAQAEDVAGLAVDPTDSQHVWAAPATGVFESRDGGASWQAAGMDGVALRWLTAVPRGAGGGAPTGCTLYAGAAGDGVYRRAAGGDWQPASEGLPANSDIIAFLADPRTEDVLWASRDGGGVYRSVDGGQTWQNAGPGMGDNLGQGLAVNYDEPDSIFLGTANAGLWVLTAHAPPVMAAPAKTAATPSATASQPGVDARIEIVWPHDWLPVEQAQQANIGLRLFAPHSLEPTSCGWRPTVKVWRSLDMAPAEPVGVAEQRTVDGQPFPYWELNDVDVRPANDPSHRLYFMVSVDGVKTGTSIWAHGVDPRTYFPQQDVPSGVATDTLNSVDARIQIVWPHDETGAERAVEEATLANVAVAFFKHGTRLSVPLNWQPQGLTLYGAWNQETGKPLAQKATKLTRQAGAITYPVWEFANIPVERARDGQNRLYLWVQVDGATTYPNIWAHGADSRTFFPARDEPIQGCVP
jgi:photosystem II stability/assembly factor-like uncharacterized protein